MGILICPMTIETVDGVFKIERACFSEPWSVNAFIDELKNPDAITLAALDNEVVGFINARKILDEVYINNVAVSKKFRRQHIAEQLLISLENKVKDNSSFITLEVRKSNIPAQSLYEKLGYEVVGERKNFYQQPTENAILMTKSFNKR